MSETRRWYLSSAEAKLLPGEEDGSILRGRVITTETRDRMGDIVRASGIDTSRYLGKNPVVLLEHGRSVAPVQVVGRTLAINRTALPDGRPALTADVEFAPTELGREVRDLVTGGFMPGASIGFRPMESRVIDMDGMPVHGQDFSRYGLPEGYGYEFTRAELLEWSVVGIPANPDAVGVIRSMPTVSRLLGYERPARVFNAGTPGTEPEADTADPERKLDLATIGLAVAKTGPEICPECEQVEVFVRPIGRFLQHHKNGVLCENRTLPNEPEGITFKRVMELVGRSLGHDAGAAREGMIAAGSVRMSPEDAAAQAAARIRIIANFAAEVEKAGRVLSAANERKIRDGITALDGVESASTAARDALQSVLAAAGVLASESEPEPAPVEQSTEPEEAKADDAIAAALARLEDPAVLRALEVLKAQVTVAQE